MTDPISTEPKRLLDSEALAGIDSTLRRDLELARSHQVEYSVQAGLARFEGSLTGASTVPAGGTLGGVSVLRWFIGATTVVGIGVVALLLFGDRSLPEPAGVQARAPTLAAIDAHADASEPPSPTRAVDVSASKQANTDFRSEGKQVVASQPSVAGTSPNSTAVVTSESVAGSELHGEPGDAGTHERAGGDMPTTTTPSPRPTPKSSPRIDASAAAIADEAKQIDAARKALASDPETTLALTEQLEREFPDGALIQERRGYAILALLALDRRTEAEERAQAYLERWPKGSLSRRIQKALE